MQGVGISCRRRSQPQIYVKISVVLWAFIRDEDGITRKPPVSVFIKEFTIIIFVCFSDVNYDYNSDTL